MSPIVRKGAPILERGDHVEATIFSARKKPMSPAELRRSLGPAVAAWIRSACIWDGDWAIGDHRFVVFAIDVAPRVQVYVQFWSEPEEPVSWEVSSGRWNPPADKWLAGERSDRIEAFGFEIGGNAENFQCEVKIASMADVISVARTVVDICCAGFDYRGLQPVRVTIGYESRAEVRLAYDSFTPEDLSKIATQCGFHVEVADNDEDAPVLRAVRRGITTSIHCADRVPDQHLFRQVMLTSDVELPPGSAGAAADAVARAAGGPPDSMQLGKTLTFNGGVTVAWLMQRIQEWDAMTWSCRKEARRRGAGVRRRPRKTVH